MSNKAFFDWFGFAFDPVVDEMALKAWQARDAEIAELKAQLAAPRGTDAQILKERELTASAISGAMAFGYLGDQSPPEEAAWLRPFYKSGQELAAKEAEIARLKARTEDDLDADLAQAITELRTGYGNAVGVLLTIERTLSMPGMTAAMVLDENSPVRDALRDALAKAKVKTAQS